MALSSTRTGRPAERCRLSAELEGIVAMAEWPRLVPMYLMSSYAYHTLDRPLLADGEYDRLCRLLDQYWEEADHPHRRHVDRAALKAGTGFYLTEEVLPSIVVGATHRLLRS